MEAARPSSAPPPGEPPALADVRLGAAAPWIGPALYLFAAATFALAVAFESIAVARLPLLSESLQVAAVSAAFSLREHVASVEWRAAVLLLAGASVAALAVAVHAVWSVRRFRAPVAALLALAGLVAAGSALAFGDTQRSTSLLRQLADAVGELGTATGGAQYLALLPKRCAEVVAGVVGVGMAAAVVLPERIGAEELERRVARLRLLLFVSAAMFVTGIVMTQTAYSWLVSFLRAGDPGGDAALAGLATAGTHLAGAFYTVTLAAAYLPAAAVLSVAARRLARANARADEDRASWLEGHGLAISWRGQVARIGALLAPLVSSALAQLLTSAT